MKLRGISLRIEDIDLEDKATLASLQLVRPRESFNLNNLGPFAY